MLDLLKEAKGIEQEVIRIRRHIHANPEIGYQESETAAFVAATLRSFGVEVTEGLGGNGVLGMLKGSGSGPCVALRADMDALAVTEDTGLPFASCTPGKMHACGHDGHTAMLLGAAKLLSTHRSELRGTIKFIFQPAEECGPLGGAKPMIDAGVMENPKVDYVFALHLWPDVPYGKVGLKQGPLMSASDRLRIDITGKGGHGAAPHQAVDAIVVASQVINALQTVVSRQVDPLEPVVVTIGSLQAGGQYNVIAPSAHMDGTVRTQNETVRKSLPQRITTLVQSVAASTGASATVTYDFGYPTLYNSPQGVELLRQAAMQVLGVDSIYALERPSMGGEDFAYFLDQAVGAMFWLGCQGPSTPKYPIHNAKFDFDEAILSHGVAMLCAVALIVK